MKLISEHMGRIIASLAAIACVIALISLFSPSVGDFYLSVVGKSNDVAYSILEELDEFDLTDDSDSSIPNLLMAGPDFQTVISPIQNDVAGVIVVTSIPDLSGITAYDVSDASDGSVMAWVEGDTLYIGANGKVVANPDSSYLFANFTDVAEWTVADLDTSQVTNMSHLFFKSSTSRYFVVNGLDGWNTSNVTNMDYAFAATDDSSYTSVRIVDLGDLSTWETGNVTSMAHMFHQLGYASENVTLGDLSGWDVSGVKDMSYMFYGVGRSARALDLGDLSQWQTGSAENMEYMFFGTGERCSFTLDLSGWDVSSVTNNTNFVNSRATYIVSPF